MVRNKSIPILLAIWFGHFAVDSFAAIWPVYKTMAGLNLVKAGLVASIGGFLGHGLQLLFGYLGDRGWSRFLVVIGALLAGTVSLVPYIDPENFFLMGFFLLLSFLGSAAFHPSATGIAGTMSKKRTGKMTALFLSGGFLGAGVSQLFFSTVYKINNGHTAIMMILPGLAAIPLFFLAPKLSRHTKSVAEVWRSTIGKRRPLLLLYLVMTLNAAVNIGIVFILPDFLKFNSAPEWVVFGGGHLFLVLGGFSGLIPFGHLADLYGPRQIILFGLALSAGAVGLITHFATDQVFILIPLLIFLGMSTTICSSVGVAYGNRLFPEHAGAISGLLMGWAWCLGGFSPIAIGWLAEPESGGNPVSAVLWIVVPLTLAFFTAYLLPRARKVKNVPG